MRSDHSDSRKASSRRTRSTSSSPRAGSRATSSSRRSTRRSPTSSTPRRTSTISCRSMDDYGIKILDSRQKEMIPRRRKSDLVSLHGLERTTDPVKLYLREMGNISLLTREGEIAIAREIERGEKSIIKALSKTRLVLNEVLDIEDRIKENPDHHPGDVRLHRGGHRRGQARGEEEADPGQDQEDPGSQPQARQLPTTRKTVFTRGRIIVGISRQIRDLNLRTTHREKIIDDLRDKLRIINELEDAREELVLGQKTSRGRRRKTRPPSRRSGRSRTPAPEVPDRDRPRPPGPAQGRPVHHDRQEDQRPGQEGARRGQPPARRLHRQEVQQPRPPVPGPHPGRQHGPDEGRREVRVPARLQVLDLRDLVDPAGHHPGHRRPGPDDPHPRPHDRDHQQAHPGLPGPRPGDRPRADLARRSPRRWTCR